MTAADCPCLPRPDLSPAASDRAALAHLAHEVRALAASVQGTLDLLACSGALPAHHALVRMLSAQAGALLALVDDTLRERKASAAPAPEAGPAIVVETVRTVALELQTLASAKGLALRVRAAPGTAGMAVALGRVKLAQIVRNLLANALKFTVAGGVELAVARGGDGRVEVAVTDTGPGIEAAALAGLFEPGAAGAHREAGSGLGLWLCAQLARQAGGTLAVTSQPGRGACFRLTLPLAR